MRVKSEVNTRALKLTRESKESLDSYFLNTLIFSAIPKDVYKKDRKEIRKESRRKGIGLLIVSGRERFTVKEKLKKYKEGTFLHLYPEAYEKWKSK